MKISVYPAMPPFFFERLTSFENEFHGKNWADLYEAAQLLKKEYPDKVFKEVPFNYVDIKNQTSGLIFVEEESEELYYVHK